MKRTLEQNKRLYKLLGDLGIDSDHKRELVDQASYGRVSSSADLTRIECDRLLDHLQGIVNGQNPQAEAAHKMRRKIMSIAHELGWETGSGDIDYPLLNAWLLKFGYLHKELKDYSEKELPQLVTQLDSILSKKLHAKN